MHEPKREDKLPQDGEAVCFTAGPKGAAFGAGVIHAWLASDRPAPLVIAGISTGAVTSAAMQKAYRELRKAQTVEEKERRRWTWFRQYLEGVTIDPFAFLWKAMPDPVEFSAERPPVKDLSVRDLPEDMREPRPPTPDGDRNICEPEARRHYYLLIKIGRWFSRLNLRVQTVARIVVSYVRWKEKYPFRWLHAMTMAANLVIAAVTLLWHIGTCPKFVYERRYRRGGVFFRPLFGWGIWLASFPTLAFVLTAAALAIAVIVCLVLGPVAVWFATRRAVEIRFTPELALTPAVVLILTSACVILFRRWRRHKVDNQWIKELLLWIGQHLFDNLDISKGLLDPFEMKHRFFRLFGEDRVDDGRGGPHLMIVCAALEQTKQVWPQGDVRIIDGLTAALAIPGVFPPVKMRPNVLETHNAIYKLDDRHWFLIDGVAVRSNPLPALFTWCQNHPEMGFRLERDTEERVDTMHVVYNVPIEPDERSGSTSTENVDIVESAMTAIQLEKRRDTRQEVRQTNFLSKLEAIRRIAKPGTRNRIRIFADEIAPEKSIDYNNDWAPTRDEALHVAAEGCRSTLQVLYNKHANARTGEVQMSCSHLLRIVAPARAEHITAQCAGLPEVCSRCTGVLKFRPPRDDEAPPPGVVRNYGLKPGESLAQKFAHLTDATGRTVFLGSGGVFRGAFHIGVVGALKATRKFPDLVVGASVGALMGGALAAIAVADREDEEIALLTELSLTFLEVDTRVALTRTLKNASKQLGIRAAEICLSPASLRKVIASGAEGDLGFAATGAPPALIDSISTLFMIPHRVTADIAADFVSGDFTKATNKVLKAIREYTLRNFDIQYALMGTSLLKPITYKLLGGATGDVNLESTQPFHRDGKAGPKKPVSFFCTTSYLNTRVSLLLGRDFLTPSATSWDFVEAALSSSAFPFVFAPRSEAQVLPGLGRTDRLFADGGMFDNLPIFPAIEILSEVQVAANSDRRSSDHRAPAEDGREVDTKEAQAAERLAKVLANVERRAEHPHVMIAAGLNAVPKSGGHYDTLFKIRERAASLSVSSKIESFRGIAKRTNDALDEIRQGHQQLAAALADQPKRAEEVASFLESVVHANIIDIDPSDKDHINGTFAFCASAGMEKNRVRRSIADGCFRTLLQFAKTGYSGAGEIRPLVWKESSSASYDCPFFSRNGDALNCPFAHSTSADVKQVRDVCAADQTHVRSATA